MHRVPARKIAERLNQILTILAHAPYPLDRETIAFEYINRYRLAIPTRTLQRDLDRLIESGRVFARGASTNTRYSISHNTIFARPETALWETPYLAEDAPALPGAELPGTEGSDIPLSPEANELRKLVHRPKELKEHVSYNAEFLFRYEPGVTWYLPQSLRDHLRLLGTTQDTERPAGSFAKDIFERLLIDLSWASSQLEGNTYDQLDTENLIKFGQLAEGHDGTEAQMILNHKRAIEFLVTNAEDIDFDKRTILHVHHLLSEDLLGNPKDSGCLRTTIIGISGAQYTPCAVPQLIEEYFNAILAKAKAIPNPFEQSFFAMVHLPYLQPFIDVNKRTSRLSANISLIKNNLCPLSFVGAPQQAYIDGTLAVYELQRIELLREAFEYLYTESCKQYRTLKQVATERLQLGMRYYRLDEKIIPHIVRSMLPPQRGVIRRLATEHNVLDEHLESYVGIILSKLIGLSPGAVAAYQLSDEEHEAWLGRYRRPIGEVP